MRKPNFTLGVEPEKIAKKVILTSDPETAGCIAEVYMKKCISFNAKRNYPGFTGTYHDKPVTVISAGIGIAQMGMLAEELYEGYGVETVVYIGVCDSVRENIVPLDYVLALSTFTDSNYPDLLGLPGSVAPTADFELAKKIQKRFQERTAPHLPKKNLNSPQFIDKAALHVGPILSSDRRITDVLDAEEWANGGVLAADMATCGLFVKAQKAGKKAASLLMVDRNVPTGEEIPEMEFICTPYQYAYMRLMVLALEVV